MILLLRLFAENSALQFVRGGQVVYSKRIDLYTINGEIITGANIEIKNAKLESSKFICKAQLNIIVTRRKTAQCIIMFIVWLNLRLDI